jgi:hypothetical protein
VNVVVRKVFVGIALKWAAFVMLKMDMFTILIFASIVKMFEAQLELILMDQLVSVESTQFGLALSVFVIQVKTILM